MKKAILTLIVGITAATNLYAVTVGTDYKFDTSIGNYHVKGVYNHGAIYDDVKGTVTNIDTEESCEFSANKWADFVEASCTLNEEKVIEVIASYAQECVMSSQEKTGYGDQASVRSPAPVQECSYKGIFIEIIDKDVEDTTTGSVTRPPAMGNLK